jgi:hypothetical protein
MCVWASAGRVIVSWWYPSAASKPSLESKYTSVSPKVPVRYAKTSPGPSASVIDTRTLDDLVAPKRSPVPCDRIPSQSVSRFTFSTSGMISAAYFTASSANETETASGRRFASSVLMMLCSSSKA